MRCPLAFVLLALIPAVAQQRPQFELASVKQNTNNGRTDSIPRRSGDLVTMHNAQLYTIIYYAYHLHGNYEMVGFKPFDPNEANWYDVDARVGRDATDDEIRLMLQTLLKDRFQLKVHRETRELPEYELTIGKGGPKLATATDKPMIVSVEGKTWGAAPGSCGGANFLDGVHLICHAATLEKILPVIGAALRSPVADHTGLHRAYDINLVYVPDELRDTSELAVGPTLPQAFQESLGLKLEKTKGPVEVLVIDRVEKPSANQ